MIPADAASAPPLPPPSLGVAWETGAGVGGADSATAVVMPSVVAPAKTEAVSTAAMAVSTKLGSAAAASNAAKIDAALSAVSMT